MTRRLLVLAVLVLGCKAPTVVPLEHPNDWRLPSTSEPPLAGFRELFVSVDAFRADHPVGDAALVLDNTASAWADVHVGPLRVGRLEPFATAVLHDVPAGDYAVTFHLPNGFVREVMLTASADNTAPDYAVPRLPGALGEE
jgi:hypothetical protein